MHLKRLALSPLILLKHGSLWPNVVTLPDSKHRVHLNPEDGRAYKKLVMDSARRRISTPMHFWRDHVRVMAPCLCLDIGANYGECFAFGDYPAGTLCIPVEANPILLPYLERTRADHPDAERIRIESCLVGDTDGVESSLFYSPTWTGGGSAVNNGAHLREAKVKSHTLDALVAGHPEWKDSPLVMKMDVEGYEGRALAGFGDLFQRERVAGIMEFDTHMLQRAETDPEALFDRLAEHFEVYLTFPRKRHLRPVRQWSELVREQSGENFHCDLAYFSRQELISSTWLII